MKCKYCGAEIGLEDLYCSHCGKPNSAAMKHAAEMDQYRKDYRQTKSQVNVRVNSFASWASRLVIFIGLLIACIIIVTLLATAPNRYYAARRQDAIQNEKEYSARMDQWLKEGDYYALSAFVYHHDILDYELARRGHYKKYLPLMIFLYDYQSTMDEFYRLAYSEDYRADNLDSLMEDLDRFYESTSEETIDDQVENKSADREMLTKAAEDMNEDIKNCLIAYGGVSKEDADKFQTYSKGKRLSLLEEVISHDEEE